MRTEEPRADGPLTYILPLQSTEPTPDAELTRYLRWLAPRAETIVVDGSPSPIFEAHREAWAGAVRHVRPAEDLVTPMGKVGNVLTGVRLASHEKLVIADDDVRYDARSLARVGRALEAAEVVRPQNYFQPLPWHALWDSSRSLINRMTGGDWPGTLGVRRSSLEKTGGYDGSVMFENLELVRTVRAAGGREAVLDDVYVLRRPSSSRHFWSQRVRQAYDELARPARFALQLSILPAGFTLALGRRWWALGAGILAVAALAEVGRRHRGADRYFPFTATLFAPLWVGERAVCSWLALASRVLKGGVAYRGGILRHAATPERALRARHGPIPGPAPSRPPESRRRSA